MRIGVSLVVNLRLTTLVYITHFSNLWFLEFFYYYFKTILANFRLMGLSTTLMNFFSYSLKGWNVNLSMEINLGLFQSPQLLFIEIELFIALFFYFQDVFANMDSLVFSKIFLGLGCVLDFLMCQIIFVLLKNSSPSLSNKSVFPSVVLFLFFTLKMFL